MCQKRKSNDNLSQLFGDIRAEHMQKCHPLSIWNYLILLGDGNNNNNRDSELGSVSSRYVRMFPGVGAAGIAPAGTGHTDHLSSNPALPLACFCSTALLMASHKSSWFSPWISTPSQSYQRPQANVLESEICPNWFVWALCLHQYSKFTAHSHPHSQVALNNKHNLLFYPWQKRRSKARRLVKSILYARQIRTLVV